MSNWFDGIAKRAARRAPAASVSVESSAVDDAGLSRRQVLARGAVLTGVAWTAPALLAARPAFAGASMCPANTTFFICGGEEVCCPAGEECVINRQGDFVCDVAPGGECTNRGNGQCNGGFSRCDQPSNTARFGICGGPGTICSDGSNCAEGNCGTDGRCGGAGAGCADNGDCAPVDANNKVAFVCNTAINGTKVNPDGTVSATDGTCQLPA